MPEEDMIGDGEMKNNVNTDGRSVFIDLEHYRRLVRTNIDMRRYKTALFWAEKVCTISQYNSKDIYWLAQCMFYLKEYQRAVHIVKLRSLEKTDIFCHYITVECLLEAKEYTEASELLNNVVCEDLISSTTIDNSYDFKQQYQQRSEYGEPSKIDILASIYYLKGKVLEAMDNRGSAMDCYVQALQYSVYCTEALDALVQHEMLMAGEENQLMSNLPFDQQCSKVDGEIIKKLYETKLKKYYKTAFPLINSEQTPIGSLNTLKSIRKLTDKMKGVEHDDSNAPIKVVNSKLLTPLYETYLSPANKFLHDLKLTPTNSLRSSLMRISTLGNSVNNSDIGANDSNRNMDNKFLTTSSASISTTIPQEFININFVNERLEFSLDMKISTAENLFYNCEYKKSMNLLESILKMDPYHTKSVTVLIGCLVELKECNKLFYLAHKLVDLYADQAISWYAVGCYYDLIGKSDQARRFLSKSTTLDRLFGPAWLAYGHSFAKENEHDQAMAAYFKATQLMRGCHLPLLYIGVECGLTKNLELAEKFFYQAMSIAPLDVYVLHELGVIKFEYEYYESAEEILRTTLDIVEEMANKNNDSISPKWEPLLNNLGHCCRKNKKYKESLHFHQFALLLKPQTPATFTAIGFVQALMGKLDDAVESLHKSLALKRDDIFTSTLLKYCMEDLLDDNNIFLDMNVPPKDITNSKVSIKINVTSPASPKNMNFVNLDAPYKLKSQKLKFDDNDSSNATPFNFDDDSSGIDMSMDL